MADSVRLAAMTAFLVKHRKALFFDARTPDSPAAAAEAAQFAADMESLGPTFIKIGQMLSTRSDLLPPEYLAALARLQDGAAPIDATKILEVIESELGARPDKLFAQFETTPIGTASFAQVHAAVLPSGREVAVKVQKPGIEAQIQADLSAIATLVSSVGLVSDIGKRYGFAEWLDEFRIAIAAELDYLQEASNLEIFAERFAAFPNLDVPEPVRDYSTARVLTMDRMRGTKVTAIPGVLRTETDFLALARELGEAYLDQIFVHGLMHADPHPGNVLLTDPPGLALLDLGMVGYVPPRIRDQLLKLVLAVSEGRGEQAAEILVHLGTRLDGFDEPRFFRETARLVARFSNGRSQAQSEGSMLSTLVALGADCGLRPPRELTMLAKTLLNLESVLVALEPTISLRRVLHERLEHVLRERALGSLDLRRLAVDALDVQELLRESPQRLSTFLRTLADNRFRVHVAGLEESRLIESIQKIANRITAGVIAAAMIVGAALMMRVDTAHRLFGYPAFALLMFLLAAGLGGALVLSSLMGDRRAGPRVEKDPL